MPIRFRCVYCNQLLGISRRKAGSVVTCAHCSGKIIVPDPQESASASAAGKSSAGTKEKLPHLFERSDFDDLLRPMQESKENPFHFDASARAVGADEAIGISDTGELPSLGGHSPLRLSDRPWFAIVLAIVFASLFFGLGFWIGRMSALPGVTEP